MIDIKIKELSETDNIFGLWKREGNFHLLNHILILAKQHIYFCRKKVLSSVIKNLYCMALSHKDWQLPNSQIWLAAMDIDRGLDFPI